MREKIMEGIRQHIHPFSGIENAELLEIAPGHAKISIEIITEALNLYGMLHGGYIFTLCDTVSGMATYAYEISNVTVQSNINFIKAMNSGTIFIEANTIHKGSRTVVNQVHITNEAGKLTTSATYTMLLFDPIE